MSLRLSLKPHEKIILGGAVLRNGSNRAEIFIENEVPVMRESDILSPHAVRTPCERIYLALQLLYVDPARAEEHRAAVAAFHAAALAAGGKDEGAVGPRGFWPNAYAGYCRDLDGNKIAAYCREPE